MKDLKRIFFLMSALFLIFTLAGCLYEDYPPIDEKQDDCKINNGSQCLANYSKTNCGYLSGTMGVCEERGCKFTNYYESMYSYSYYDFYDYFYSYVDSTSCTSAGGTWLGEGDGTAVNDDCIFNSGYQCYANYSSTYCSYLGGTMGVCTELGCKISNYYESTYSYGYYDYYDNHYKYYDSTSCTSVGGVWLGK